MSLEYQGAYVRRFRDAREWYLAVSYLLIGRVKVYVSGEQRLAIGHFFQIKVGSLSELTSSMRLL
jgi:hypothetical protein